jgi:hypothetical protein
MLEPKARPAKPRGIAKSGQVGAPGTSSGRARETTSSTRDDTPADRLDSPLTFTSTAAPALQLALADAAPPPAASPTAEQDATDETRGTERSLVVADDADPGHGQMRKSEFLRELRGRTCPAADQILAEAGRSTDDCPYIEAWFGYYDIRSAEQVDRALQRYAQGTAALTTAVDAIERVVARIRVSVATWVRTGEVTGLPEGSPSLPPASSGTPSATPLALQMKTGEAAPPSAAELVALPAEHDGNDRPLGVEDGRDADATPGQVDPGELQRRLGPGRPLDSSVRMAMGGALNADFSGVRVHDDPQAGSITRSLEARAFAVGGHVAFAPNEYAPGTLRGDALIAHELAHVVQQGAAPVTDGAPEAARVTGLEADADSAAASAVAALHRGHAAPRGRGPALRTGLQLSRCYPRTVPREVFEPKSPFDQPELKGDEPVAAPEQTPPIGLDEAANRLRIMEGVLTRLTTRYAKDKAVTDAAAQSRSSLDAVRASIGIKAAETARRIDLGQTILDRCETNLMQLEAMRAKISAESETERGRAGFLAVIDKTREAYVKALGAALSDGQVEAFNQAEQAGAGLPRGMTEVNLGLMEKPEGENDKDSKFREEVVAWVGWTRTELDKLQADAEVVAKARRMHAPDLADREKRFKQKAELMDLSLRGLAHYDRASRAERILEGWKPDPGIQDDLVALLTAGRQMQSAAETGNLDRLREVVTKHEADPNVATFYKMVPAYKFGADFAASLGIVLIASIATAGIGGVATLAIGETATLGGTLLAAGGTAAIEAFTFTLVTHGLQSKSPDSFLNDFAWNFGLFGVLKGVGLAAGAAAEAAELPKGIGSVGAAVVSFPLMHGYGVLRFRLTSGRWPTKAELDRMVTEELVMFLGITIGMRALMPEAGKPSQLGRLHSEFGTKFEALEIARRKVIDDYVALVEKGGAADKAQVADLQKKAQLVEDTFKSIRDEILKDKQVDWTALKAELARAGMAWIEGSAELLAKQLGVPETVGLRSAGGDQRSYTYHWGKTGKLADGLSALKARVEISAPDPVSGQKTLTVTMSQGEPPLTFAERADPYPAAREVDPVDPAAPEIAGLTSDLGVTDAAAGRELIRMIQAAKAKNPTHELKSHVKVVRRAISDALKSPEAKGLDANGYLKTRAAKGALAFHAEPRLVAAAEKLEAGGILSTPKWLELRDASGDYVGLVGEKLAGDMALASAKPGQTVLRNVRIVGDAFTDAALSMPAVSSEGRPIVDTDVASEVDLMTGEMSGKTFSYSQIANVKTVQPRGSGEPLKQAKAQSAEAHGALQAHEAGRPYQRADGTWVRIKKVTAIDASSGVELDLTGNIKAGAAVTEETIGPAVAAKGKDTTAWSQRLPYTRAEIATIAELLREMQAMRSKDY